FGDTISKQNASTQASLGENMTRRGNYLPLRQLLVIFTGLLLCLSVIPPLPTLAQADLATPIAPANPEADADESLGTQSVAFARFEQSSTTAAAGGSVDMTLFITSTVQETTSGTFT